MDDLTICEQIKILSNRAGVSLADLARMVGDSPQNFSQKMKRDNFRVADLEKIADVLGYSFKWDFVKNE